MTKLKHRVARLEGPVRGRERLIIAVGPDGFDIDDEIDRRGLVVMPADLLVVISDKPDHAPVTVTVDGVAVTATEDTK